MVHHAISVSNYRVRTEVGTKSWDDPNSLEMIPICHFHESQVTNFRPKLLGIDPNCRPKVFVKDPQKVKIEKSRTNEARSKTKTPEKEINNNERNDNVRM